MQKVKLAARCHVNGEVKEAGAVVELNDEIAAHFGEIVPPEPIAETATEAETIEPAVEEASAQENSEPEASKKSKK